MRKDAQPLEEARLRGVESIEDYPSLRERHRAFPEIFEERKHRRMLDVAAGVGAAACRIQSLSGTRITCNDLTHTALKVLHKQGLPTLSFDIDDERASFPFCDASFDAVLSLATIEHVIQLDHHLQEVRRILTDGGFLYISTPNYAALTHLPAYLLAGRSFHNPLKQGARYEFYAHVRYFTYRTLLEFVSSFGFTPVAVYLPLPGGSSFYRSLYARSRPKALAFRYAMWAMYTFCSPRWAPEPVLCFQKSPAQSNGRFRKVVVR